MFPTAWVVANARPPGKRGALPENEIAEIQGILAVAHQLLGLSRDRPDTPLFVFSSPSSIPLPLRTVRGACLPLSIRQGAAGCRTSGSGAEAGERAARAFGGGVAFRRVAGCEIMENIGIFAWFSLFGSFAGGPPAPRRLLPNRRANRALVTRHLVKRVVGSCPSCRQKEWSGKSHLPHPLPPKNA